MGESIAYFIANCLNECFQGHVWCEQQHVPYRQVSRHQLGYSRSYISLRFAATKRSTICIRWSLWIRQCHKEDLCKENHSIRKTQVTEWLFLSHSDTISFYCRANHLFPAKQWDYPCPTDIRSPKVVRWVRINSTIIIILFLTIPAFSEVYQHTYFPYYSFASELHPSSFTSCTSALVEIFGWPVHPARSQPS